MSISQHEREVLAQADLWLEGHRESMLDILSGWVVQPSVCREDQAEVGAPFGPDVAAMFARVRQDAHALGLHVDEHDGLALSMPLQLGRSQPGLPIGGQDEIGLVGHLDVVPAGKGWTRTPFAMVREGEFLFGRGVADCKGPSLIDLCVLRMIRDIGVPLRHRLRVILGGGEEVAMNDIRGYLRRWKAPGFSLVTDGPFPVNYGQKGILNIELSIRAEGAWQGWSAGSASNAVPGEATLHVDGLAQAEAEQALAALTDAEAATGYGVPYSEVITLRPADDHRGVVIAAQGRAGHAAFQEGTSNAIAVLARFLKESRILLSHGRIGEHRIACALALIASACDGGELAIDCSDESGALSFNLGMVRANDGMLVLGCDIRYPVTFCAAVLRRRLLSGLQSMPQEWGVSLRSIQDQPAYRIDPRGPECTALTRVFDDFFDVTSTPFTMGGGTHSRLLPRSATFGADFWYMDDLAKQVGHPGKPDDMPEGMGGAHGPDECVNFDNLLIAAKMYVLAVMRLDAELPGGSAETSLVNERAQMAMRKVAS